MAEGAARPSWLEWLAGDAYSLTWQAVIRPPRARYSTKELGPVTFELAGTTYVRKDLQLTSGRGHTLECSHFLPSESSGDEEKRPCVVYLHGNASSRLEALNVLPLLLPRGVTVFCLDLSGSGLSGGDYISLGHYEEKDLAVALRHLRRSGEVTSIGLWGRSMGAVTAILRATKDRCLAACVLDSPFAELRTVAEELLGQSPVFSATPQFAIDMALEVVKEEVQRRAGFDADDLAPSRCAAKAKCPAMFGAAKGDSLILPHHAQELADVWGGKRLLHYFPGDHNDVRPVWFLESAADFLALHLHGDNNTGALKLGGLALPWSKPVGNEITQEEQEAPLIQELQLLPSVVPTVEATAARTAKLKALASRALAAAGRRPVLDRYRASDTTLEALRSSRVSGNKRRAVSEGRRPSKLGSGIGSSLLQGLRSFQRDGKPLPMSATRSATIVRGRGILHGGCSRRNRSAPCS